MIVRSDSPLATALHPSPNIEPRANGGRPRLLILHYTGVASTAKAIDWLSRAESRVSCHYVIDEAGAVTQMVAEHMRAWHAGASFWAGETDINSHSIGIEIQNPGHDGGYPDFPEPQMRAIVALARDIVARHGMRPEHVLAHSDVAPRRKIDPGEKFDWARLARAGVGLWVEPAAVDPADAGTGLGYSSALVARVQPLLSAHGYGIATHGTLDDETACVLRAFQRHFRPARVDGCIDRSTADTIERLVACRAR